MASQPTPPKKVRLACRRCRVRRIKCDGQVPACTNCAKAGQVCLDVDSQNSSLTIPRNFVGAARERIEWLEDIVRHRLPDVDLASGPRIDAYPDIAGVLTVDREHGDGDSSTVSPVSPSKQQGQTSQTRRRSSLKRSAESTNDQSDLQSERAHSIAMSLGMLSLNSDSSQKHYLGSSSGLLFTSLIATSPSTDVSTTDASPDVPHLARDQWHDGGAADHLVREHYQSLHNTLRQELPRKEDAMALVQTYIRWIHPDYPVLEPASIYQALDALYSCASFSDVNDPMPGGWPSSLPSFRWNGRNIDPQNLHGEIVPMPVMAFILFMIFNVAAIFKVRSRVYEYSPERYYRAAKEFSNDCFSRISLSSIQGLVVLIAHCMLTPGEANLWTLVHIALAHCVELGVHRESSSAHRQDLARQQIRRFLFFTIYGLDRSISSIQGRPLGFRDETFDVRMPDLQDQVQVETGLIPPSFSAAVTRYSTYCFQIHRIISDIKLSFYHLPRGGDDSDSFLWPEDPEAHQMRIEEALSSWWETVSQDALSYPCLDDKQRRIWKAKLKVTYHKTMTLLHQPSQAIRSPSVQSLLKCFDNASVVLHEYQNLNDLRGFQHGWRAVHNIFAAGATIIYSFWTSEIVRQNASMESLSKSLRICSSLLALGGEWWPSVKNGLANFGTVADLTVRKLYTDGAPNKTPRLSMRHDVTLLSRLQEESAGFGPPDDIPAQALTGALQATGTHPDQHQLTEADGASMEGPWISLYPDTEPQMTDGGCAPEIGSFLANFDNADFTWSFTLDGLDNQDGMRGFSSFNI